MSVRRDDWGRELRGPGASGPGGIGSEGTPGEGSGEGAVGWSDEGVFDKPGGQELTWELQTLEQVALSRAADG